MFLNKKDITFILSCIFLWAEVLSTGDFEWLNLPAVSMDYKVHVDPGREDCYYQYVNPGATFYVSFQVLRGGDGMAGFAVRHPSGQLVLPYQWKPNAEYQDQQSTGGYYHICVDNQFSRFADKLVNLYMTVIRYDHWEEYAKELEELDLSVANFTKGVAHIGKNIYLILKFQNHFRGMEARHYNLLLANNKYVQWWSVVQIFFIVLTSVLQESILTVEKNINEMLQHQNHFRGMESRHYNLLLDNNTYVQRWSLIQIFVTVATTVLQVYFVKKLFTTKMSKPRA